MFETAPDKYPTSYIKIWAWAIRKYAWYYLVYKVALLATLLTFLFCGCSARLKNYKVPTEFKTTDCPFYFYAGECWNRSWSVMISKQTVVAIDPATGMLVDVPISPLLRIMELHRKAYLLTLESPEDAPLAEIWLVYCGLSTELAKLRAEARARRQREEVVTITPRQQ